MTHASHESWRVRVQSTQATPAFQTVAPYVATLDYRRDGLPKITEIYHKGANQWVEIGNIDLREMYSGHDTVQITRILDDHWFMTPVDLSWIPQLEASTMEDSLMEDAPMDEHSPTEEDSPMEGSLW